MPGLFILLSLLSRFQEFSAKRDLHVVSDCDGYRCRQLQTNRFESEKRSVQKREGTAQKESEEGTQFA